MPTKGQRQSQHSHSTATATATAQYNTVIAHKTTFSTNTPRPHAGADATRSSQVPVLGVENDTLEGRAFPGMEGAVGDTLGEPPPNSGIPESDVLPDDLNAQAEESVAVKVRRDLVAPTRLEIEEHEAACHEPYRNWCVPCVAGRGKADPHRGRDHSEDGVITMGIDHGYLNKRAKPGEDDEGEEDTEGVKASPLLCGRDT